MGNPKQGTTGNTASPLLTVANHSAMQMTI